jgi:hypothetical protein
MVPHETTLSPEVKQAFEVLRSSMIDANENALAFLADLRTPATLGELLASFVKLHPIESKGTTLFGQFLEVLMRVHGGEAIDDIWTMLDAAHRGKPN